MIKNSPKTDHLIAICSILLMGMVHKRCYLVNPHVQTELAVLAETLSKGRWSK